MAQSSVLEYEIGILVSRALDKVGDLVVLNSERVKMHSAISRQQTEPFNMADIHRELRQALLEAFTDHKLMREQREGEGSIDAGSSTCQGLAPSQSRCRHRGQGQATESRLTNHQLQELGAAFGRDPSTLGPVVEPMWLSGNCCPDLAGVVTRPSPFLMTF